MLLRKPKNGWGPGWVKYRAAYADNKYPKPSW